jgi:hypothetical protein
MTLNPINILELALKVDRRSAAIIVVGLAAFAAAGILKTIGIGDLKGSVLAVAYVLGAGIIVSLFAQILGDRFAKVALSWAVTLLIIVFMGSVAYGAIVPNQTFVNPPSCVLRFWEPCVRPGGVLDRIASSQAPVTPIPSTPPSGSSAPGTIPTERVFFQFAGLISRENMVKVATGLAAQGWHVQDAPRGGERIPAAAGLNEVRYANPKSKAAADRLAAELNATQIAERTIQSRQVNVPNFPDDSLEVWISR